ncbi:MAG: DUF899 family protein [Immundisolibacter sp.]|uniref:DUF899 family protein n=1 Tax=Immundisolibacter sp. TaxID=1934948 RepID=UPI003D0C2D59
MGTLHDRHFPNESATYRSARDALLKAEAALREQTEAVAALRRALPPGGALPDDYCFTQAVDERSVRFSELFRAGQDTLVVYSYMYGPTANAPCPLCSSMLDSLDGAAPHIGQHLSLAVVAKAPAPRLAAVARQRGWRHLRLLSSAGTTYNADYLAEDAAGNPWPMLNVFRKTAAGIHHTWGSELFYAARAPGQHTRHVDSLWPLWNALDLTPAGRHPTWLPALAYDPPPHVP